MSYPSALVCVNQAQFMQLISSLSLTKNFTVIEPDHCDWLSGLSDSPDVAIIEVNTFEQSHYDTLQALNFCPETDIIFLSEGIPNPLLDKAVVRCAAYHYRTPIKRHNLAEVIEELTAEYQQRPRKTKSIESSELDQFGLLFGSSRAMKKLYRSLRKVAMYDTSILIVGESGVGKELVANTIHNASERAESPFVTVNCGALSKDLATSDLFGHVKGAFTGAVGDRTGFFTEAKGGTLFLDEVTEMPEELQVQLLRVLETGDYSPVGSNKVLNSNVRIIAATNRDLAQSVNLGVFREDLYFRLAQFLLHVPPLRSRGGDVEGLAKHFLAYKNASAGFGKKISDTAIAKISDYHWPGNVRELKHAVERAYIMSIDVIDGEHIILEDPLNDEVNDQSVPTGIPLAEVEKQAILNTLEEQHGNKSDTAKLLDISVKTLYNKLEKYDE
ncbi:sigma-54 interaction domain-containing protein [Thalassotalea hakodatensis]|uniref:sigma-54 interaction domain-containing protein n=1 Tax=Thalassotalea hakodatensis TaxID=3030492 RepID=UPI002573DABD|nr:sigma-54 dependent transcriptional regulator [Thalassotalea hakodatensis]